MTLVRPGERCDPASFFVQHDTEAYGSILHPLVNETCEKSISSIILVPHRSLLESFGQPTLLPYVEQRRQEILTLAQYVDFKGDLYK